MGNTKPNTPVVGAPTYVNVKHVVHHSFAYWLHSTNPPPPAEFPPPEDLQPGPVLVRVCEFVRTHIAAIAEYLFPEIQVTTDPGPIMPRRGRGMQHTPIVGPPPLVFIPAAVQRIPGQCQRPLVLVVSAICSSAVIIWLSSLIGPVNLPTSILPADLPVYLTRVLDVANTHAGHVSGNVVAASACIVEVGLRLVGLACDVICDSSNPTLTVSTRPRPHPSHKTPQRVVPFIWKSR
ncbi:hypothetical protein RSAG8_07736, partial [Rhizoctonia solani AG-8 WAC10335]